MQELKTNIKVFICILFFLLSSSGQVPILLAEKLGSSLSTDSVKQDDQQNLKSAPSVTVAPPITATSQQIVTPPPLLPQHQKPLPLLQTAIPNIKVLNTLKGPADLKPPKITVPDFEKQLMERLQKEYEKKMMASKQRKSLIDSVLEEIVRYGYFIVLGLVILVVFYALRKEPKRLPPASEEPQVPPASSEKTKKDIWSKEF